MPFCSQRCRLIDLNQWLDEEYSLFEETDGSPEGFFPPEEQPD